uniref:Uncharacterized protein n=1 Tax=Anguilla anguilla TaxID=7936 RepID=A0A0E9QSH5_ANGAN
MSRHDQCEIIFDHTV